MLRAISLESGYQASLFGPKVIACALTWDGNDSTQTIGINDQFRKLCREKGPTYAHLSHEDGESYMSDDDCRILQHFEFKCSVAPKSCWVHIGTNGTPQPLIANNYR